MILKMRYISFTKDILRLKMYKAKTQQYLSINTQAFDWLNMQY